MNIDIPFHRNTHEFCRALDAEITSEYGGITIAGLLAFNADNEVIDTRVYFIGRAPGDYDLPHGDGPEGAEDSAAWVTSLGDEVDYIMSFNRRPHVGQMYPAYPSPHDINLVDGSVSDAHRYGYTYRGHIIVTEYTEGVILDPDDTRIGEAEGEGIPMIDMDAPPHNHGDVGRELLRRMEGKMQRPEQGHAAEPTDLPRPEIPKAFLN
jgi:hypothetical protein